MRFRYLRIAFSITCGIACVLLVVLWVRSYWWTEIFELPLTAKHSVTGGSFPGVCEMGFPRVPLGWTYSREPSKGTWQYDKYDLPSSLFGTFIFDTRSALVPYWFSFVMLAAVATLPWLRLQFSLRTLIIGMTLLAVVLGVAVWSTR